MAQKNCIDCNCLIDRTGKWKPGRRCHNCYKKKIYRKRKELKQLCVDYHGDKCLDCGKSFPNPVYDFHHIEDNKDSCIGHMTHKCQSWETISGELDKCVMLCANCHRIRHFDSK